MMQNAAGLFCGVTNALEFRVGLGEIFFLSAPEGRGEFSRG